ncbi:MAG: substrate-binding domain-containing protein [Chitinispirillaceae bacterium]|nr:substrate-binding domain-containing protein [Chitinispirillaceae bacterium]
MKKKRNFRVAFLTDNLYIHYCREVWTGILSAAKTSGFDNLTFVGGSLNDPNYYLAGRNFIYDHIRLDGIDGIITNSGSLGNYTSDNELQKYYERFASLPLVSIGMKLDNYPSIIVDNKIGMKALVHHFVKVHGYRKIGFIRGPEGVFDAEIRFAAYREALAENNIEFDPLIVSPGKFDKSSGIKAVSYYLDLRRLLPEAIIAANDDMAVAAMTEFSMRGIDIPIGGFDNNYSSLSYYPPLTTVQQPIFQLGKKAVEIIYSLLHNEETPKLTVLPTSIIIRRSCGCFYESSEYNPISTIPDDKYIGCKSIAENLKLHFSTIGNSLHNQDWADVLVKSMEQEIKNRSHLNFLMKLEPLIIESLDNRINISEWFNCFSYLLKQLKLDEVETDFIFDLKTKIFSFLGNKSVIYEISKRNILEDESNYFQFLSNSLITTFKMEDLEKIFTAELPKFRIKYFYLFLFVPGNPEKLHLVYYLNRYLDITIKREYFDSTDIFNEVLYKGDECQYSTILPLFFQNEKLGIIISDIGTQNGIFYENIMTHISSVIKRAELTNQLYKYTEKLEQEVEKRTSELAKAQDQLVQSEKLAALGQLIAGISHEINTPLGAIRSSIDNINDILIKDFPALPDFYKNLPDQLYPQFSKLLQAGFLEKCLSSREERAIKRNIINLLENIGIRPEEEIVQKLFLIGIYENVEQFTDILKDSQSRDILDTAFKINALLRSSKTILSATQKVSKITFALKNYSRFDSSGKKSDADIRDTLETVLTLYQNQLKLGVEVIKDFQPLPLIQCYPDELTQIWTNIIQNAAHAMQFKGKLTIITADKDDFIEVTISDTGIGIAPEIINKIFEPFFTTKSFGEGSGLGLHISKQIIEKHKGVIEVSSSQGLGTTFLIKIPKMSI